jgi:hypothetical protein
VNSPALPVQQSRVSDASVFECGNHGDHDENACKHPTGDNSTQLRRRPQIKGADFVHDQLASGRIEFRFCGTDMLGDAGKSRARFPEAIRRSPLNTENSESWSSRGWDGASGPYRQPAGQDG